MAILMDVQGAGPHLTAAVGRYCGVRRSDMGAGAVARVSSNHVRSDLSNLSRVDTSQIPRNLRTVTFFHLHFQQQLQICIQSNKAYYYILWDIIAPRLAPRPPSEHFGNSKPNCEISMYQGWTCITVWLVLNSVRAKWKHWQRVWGDTGLVNRTGHIQRQHHGEVETIQKWWNQNPNEWKWWNTAQNTMHIHHQKRRDLQRFICMYNYV